MAGNNGMDSHEKVEYIIEKGVKQYICPCCGNDIFVSTSRYFCQYCHTLLQWPTDQFNKSKKSFKKQ